jgi:hypothetical protein
MKALTLPNGTVEVTLSRRNLMILLSKLDRGEQSAATIYRRGDGDQEPTIIVSAEEDDLHYADRVPGTMHHFDEHRVKTGWTPKE